jgi:arylsulfate sulfotransferase
MRTSVVVVDTDGEVRWVGTSTASASTIFTSTGFVVGSPTSTQVARLELDGEVTGTQVADPSLVEFTHNIDRGKVGLLAEFDAQGEMNATVAEIDSAGTLLAGWELGDLLAAYMAEAGDDPSLFVRPGTDWFHLNAATYDPRDDSLIVSSRENFLTKIDYATGHPIWILGDPTKYWAQFPSLRERALTLLSGGYPIGQHATSITSDGLLMVFNDGTPSVNQPAGAPAGQALSASAVSAYDIDPVAMTAREVWRFEHQPALTSAYCSSAYEAGQSLLVNYAQADNGSTVRVLGLDSSRQVVFDLAYRNTAACDTSWNAVPVPFDALRFDE